MGWSQGRSTRNIAGHLPTSKKRRKVKGVERDIQELKSDIWIRIVQAHFTTHLVQI